MIDAVSLEGCLGAFPRLPLCSDGMALRPRLLELLLRPAAYMMFGYGLCIGRY